MSDDVLVLWDIDGTLLNSGGVGRSLYEEVFLQLFGRSLAACAPMAGRTDRAIILETLTMAGVDEPRRYVDPFIVGLGDRARAVQDAIAARGQALPGAADAVAALASARSFGSFGFPGSYPAFGPGSPGGSDKAGGPGGTAVAQAGPAVAGSAVAGSAVAGSVPAVAVQAVNAMQSTGPAGAPAPAGVPAAAGLMQVMPGPAAGHAVAAQRGGAQLGAPQLGAPQLGAPQPVPRPFAGSVRGPVATTRPGRRVYQSVLTGNVRPLAEVKLTALGLRDGIDLCIGAYGDDHEDRTELVHVARRRAAGVVGQSASAFSGTSTVVIGDTPLDVSAARAAGARAVGVATGSYSAAELAEAGAHAVLADLTDTTGVLRALLA